MLAFIAHQQHAGAYALGHVKQLHHVARAKLRCLINQDDAVAGRLRHFFVHQKHGHRVGIGKPGLLPEHVPCFHRLGQGNRRPPKLGQRFADFLFQRRLAGAGHAANQHHFVTGAQHMLHSGFLF